MKIDGLRVRGCDILLVETRDLVHLGLGGCKNLMDQCIMNVVNRCLQLRSIDLTGCGQATDAGVLALGAGCGQLQSINLRGCGQVTDAGDQHWVQVVVSCRASILHIVVR